MQAIDAAAKVRTWSSANVTGTNPDGPPSGEVASATSARASTTGAHRSAHTETRPRRATMPAPVRLGQERDERTTGEAEEERGQPVRVE